MKFLIVVDMPKDFINGALGTQEAVAIVPNVVEKIKGFDGKVITTMDTHDEGYFGTKEGRMLPVPHCIKLTEGWELNGEVTEAIKESGNPYEIYMKHRFATRFLTWFRQRSLRRAGVAVPTVSAARC